MLQYNWTDSTSTCYCVGGLQRPNVNGQDVSLGGARPVGEWFNGHMVTAVRASNAHNVDFSMFKSFKPLD